ncbi:MAG: phage tail protein [Desulfobulbaceae bacterium]|nr:phage tail protein [Desulfobulbaceae bacterium]
MPNRREFDHIGNFSFKVEIEGVTAGSFMEVEGLESTTEVACTTDGDDRIVRKRPAKTTCSNLLLRRGFKNNDELWNWYKVVLDGHIERKSGSIIICGDDASEIMRYNFYEAWPCRWKLSKLSAAENGTLIEEVEVAIEKIERG